MMFCFGKPKAVLVMGTETLLNRGSDGGNTLLPIFLFHFDISTNHIYQLAYCSQFQKFKKEVNSFR